MTIPEPEQKPSKDDSPTQPGARLRRLVSAEDEPSSQPVEKKTTPPTESGQSEVHNEIEKPSATLISPDQMHTVPLIEMTPPSGTPRQAKPFVTDPMPKPINREDQAGSIPPFATTIHPKPEPQGFSPTAQTQAQLPKESSEEPTIPPPPGMGTMGLPHQPINQIDLNATRVTPSAMTPPSRYHSTPPPPFDNTAGPQPPSGQSPRQQSYQAQLPRPVQSTRQANFPPQTAQSGSRIDRKTPTKTRQKGSIGFGGCLLRGIIALLFLGVIAVLIVGSFAVYQYFSIASSLPDVSNLRSHASKFETTRILDRNGNVLYEILDPNAGRRTYVPLSKISPYLIAATLATEDKDFYTHPGFDPLAIARALISNYTAGEITSGASTITQQLARLLLLDPQERYEQTVQRKAREIVLAAELTRKYSKEEILEIYFNEIYYGNMAYGIEAAAETYFHTTADKLTLAQGAFLAGLPQAPSVYDIFTNRDATLKRYQDVLLLMYNLSKERNCIYVSTNIKPVCVGAVEFSESSDAIQNTEFKLQNNGMRYPHWVNYIRSLLESEFDSQTIYRSGFTVYTTLDPGLQDQAQQLVSQQISALADRHVTNGALVAIKPSTGEILAMVGSADFNNDAIAGQINMAVSPRQPGSSIKPLTYTAAFEKGWNPATLIWDVPTGFPPSGDPNDPRDPYKPVNYDGKFHGPVTVRVALANSFNIPAVKTLNYVGIFDNPKTPQPDGFINFAKKMGITTLTRNDYGLSLTLGGGDVSLLELTGAYSIFANGGRRVPPTAITKIVDYTGKVVFEYKPPAGDQVIRPEHAFLMSSILSDNNARKPMFGANSVLNLGFPVAAKTGTTNDFRDNWTLGYTPDVTVGVWVGNADYTPMKNTTGLTGAAPIWSEFMKYAIQQLTGNNPTPFAQPAGVVERVICAVSGTEPSEWCPSQRGEYFASDQLPLPKEQDLWQKIKIDTWTGLLASPGCSDFTDEKFALNVKDPDAIKWIKDNDAGRAWAKSMGFSDTIFFVPTRECKPDDSRPQIIFAGLSDGQTINTAPLDLYLVVQATSNFKDWRLEYGIGGDPGDWKVLVDTTTTSYDKPQLVYTWDMKDVPAGKITLRVRMNSTNDTYAEKRITLNIQVPTPTPTLTPTPTITMTPTSTSTPVPPTLTPTQEPTLTDTPMPTLAPSSTP